MYFASSALSFQFFVFFYSSKKGMLIWMSTYCMWGDGFVRSYLIHGTQVFWNLLASLNRIKEKKHHHITTSLRWLPIVNSTCTLINQYWIPILVDSNTIRFPKVALNTRRHCKLCGIWNYSYPYLFYQIWSFFVARQPIVWYKWRRS